MPPKRIGRSRSRQTTPQSPPKQPASNSSPRLSRRGTRSQSREIDQHSAQQKRINRSLPVVDEEHDSDGEVEVGGVEGLELDAPSDSDIARSITNARVNSDDDIDDTSSNGTTQLEALDIDLIIDNLSALYQAATRIPALFESDDVLRLVQDVKDPTSKTSKRLHNFLGQLESSRGAYGGGSYINVQLINHKLVGSSNVNEGPWRPDAILQLANLSLFVAELSSDDQAVIADTLERMFNTFPEPFGNFGITIGQTTYNTHLMHRTISFGIALRTQFFLKTVERSQHNPAFDPDSILNQVFFDEDDRLVGFQVDGEEISPEAETAVLDRLRSIRKQFKKSSTHSIDLKQLKRKYSWQEFLVEAFQWISLRKDELETEIAAQGGIEAVQSRLEQSDFTPYDNQTPDTQATPDVMQPGNGNPEPQVGEVIQSQLKQAATPKRPETSTLAKRILRLKDIQAQEDQSSSEESDEGEEIRETEQRQRQEPQHSLQQTLNDRLRPTVTEIPQSPQIDVDNDQFEGDMDENIAIGIEDEVIEPEVPPETIDPTQGDLIPTQKTLAVLEVAREQAAISNKENIDITRRSYNDKQANAKRLEWNDSQPSHKRVREEVGNDEDESDEYETDARPQKRQRLPRPPPALAAEDWLATDGDDGDDGDDEVEQEASQQLRNTLQSPHRAASHSRPPTQPLPQPSPLANRDEQRTSRPQSSSHPQARHQTISSARTITTPPDPDPNPNTDPPSPAQAHLIVNAEAKARMRRRPHLDRNFTTAHDAQVRRPWTYAETERLLEMIEKYGCRWSHILTRDAEHPEGAKLKRRTQVQLKDKARNVKMDYLKAGVEIPEGFDAVTIKKSDKELLKALGLPLASISRESSVD